MFSQIKQKIGTIQNFHKLHALEKLFLYYALSFSNENLRAKLTRKTAPFPIDRGLKKCGRLNYIDQDRNIAVATPSVAH